MPEPTALAGELEGELRRYFAATTSTALPIGVLRISARELGRRRAPWAGWLAGGLGVLATAALAVVVATHAGSHGGAGSSALSAGSLAPQQSAAAPPGAAATGISYPGIDMSRLQAGGVVLLDPAGHGSASLSGVQAQAAAAGAIGPRAGTPGPALLAFVQVTPPAAGSTTCLCWVVDVPVSGGVAASPGASAAGTELVLIDAITGHLVATLSGNGIP